jgi:hypothetical protein
MLGLTDSLGATSKGTDSFCCLFYGAIPCMPSKIYSFLVCHRPHMSYPQKINYMPLSGNKE